MSGANYEYCPGCDMKALYVGEYDVASGVVVWHEKCREAQLQAAKREARDQAIEDCAKLAEREADSCDVHGPTTEGIIIRYVVDLLRGLSTPSEANDG